MPKRSADDEARDQVVITHEAGHIVAGHGVGMAGKATVFGNYHWSWDLNGNRSEYRGLAYHKFRERPRRIEDRARAHIVGLLGGIAAELIYVPEGQRFIGCDGDIQTARGWLDRIEGKGLSERIERRRDPANWYPELQPYLDEAVTAIDQRHDEMQAIFATLSAHHKYADPDFPWNGHTKGEPK